MKYKLIVADFDDTIMDESMEISDTLSETVKRYEAAGGHFRIATGRMTSSILSYARKLGFKGEVASYQGSVISDIETGQTIRRFPMSAEAAAEIAEYLEEKGIYFHTYEGDNIVLEKASVYSKIYQNLCSCGSLELGRHVSDYIREKNLSPVKIILMDDPENIPGYIEDLTKRFGKNVLVNTSKEWLVEVIAKGINKGLAVAWLAERLGVKREETISIGDSMNDATMLEWTGLSFCVENGSDAAKKVAKSICPACDQKGVEWVIRKYGLEEDV